MIVIFVLSMIKDEQFQEIRPFRNNEFHEVMVRILKDPAMDIIIKTMFPDAPVEMIKGKLLSLQSVENFQKEIIYSVVQRIINLSSSGFSYSGIDKIDRNKSHLYISNHRDIVLDPSLINYALFEQGINTIEIAIGDNLLKMPWIKDLVRINKSFIVKRDLPIRELIVASKLLSEYISTTIFENGNSAWIAQREGRAKDGNDRTQAGLINMVGMANKGNLKDYFLNLNIIPVALSYEKDPCDIDKVRSIYGQKYLGGYKKAENEDVESMKKGIMGPKAGIHFHFCESISEEIEKIPDNLHRNDINEAICNILDKNIIGSYKLWPNNYIAYDLLHDKMEMGDHYSLDQRKEFEEEISVKLQLLEGDKDVLRKMFYDLYARPLMNKLLMSENHSQTFKTERSNS